MPIPWYVNKVFINLCVSGRYCEQCDGNGALKKSWWIESQNLMPLATDINSGNVFRFMKLEESMAGEDSKLEETCSGLVGTHFRIGKIKFVENSGVQKVRDWNNHRIPRNSEWISQQRSCSRCICVKSRVVYWFGIFGRYQLVFFWYWFTIPIPNKILVDTCWYQNFGGSTFFPPKRGALDPFWSTQPPFWGKKGFLRILFKKRVPRNFKKEFLPNPIVQKIPAGYTDQLVPVPYLSASRPDGQY